MVLPDTEATKLCSPLAKKKICSKSPAPGALQQHLFYGEYSPFKYAPIFENDFIQVTKKGEVLSIHKDITVVTVGVTSTSPNFILPNVMLLARPINSLREMVCNCRISTDRCPMELTRLFPLCFVSISIHDVYNRQLRLKLANGRAFYLQLYVHPECENEVFERWMKLVALLHNSAENVYGYEAVTPEIECILEQTSAETLATELSDWQLEEPAMSPTMREYYEANRASSRKSGKSGKSGKSEKSEKSEKPEDCSTRTRSRSQKSNSGKAGENFPDFSQEQEPEPWPPVKPPEKKKKTRGPIGFNFFKKDKGSKEKSPEKDQVPRPVTTPTEDEGKLKEEEGKLKEEEESKENDGKKSDEGKGRQKEKSKGKEGKEMKQKNKDKKEKMEKQAEKEQQLKEKEEKRQQEIGKKKGREDKGGTDKGWKQQEKEEREQEKEERRRAKEAKQREKEEKKQRAMEERKQREEEKKRSQ